MLIGTHRLLSKDVEFKKLGLLVVDEEQRFGVAHKERLKRMITLGRRRAVHDRHPDPAHAADVAGRRARPLRDRDAASRDAWRSRPTLMPFRKNVLAQAIRQELRREGQVFVVHNRGRDVAVRSPERRSCEMVPDARIVTAHGQMPERTSRGRDVALHSP